MKSHLVLVLIVLLTSLTACTEEEPIASADVNPEKPTVTVESQITAALEALLQRSLEEDDCFVTIEDRQTAVLVQFKGSKTEPLMLYLPSKPLSSEDAQRAEAFFADLGVSVGEEGAYQLDLGRDASRASEIALRVFREVYQLEGDLDLVLAEH